MGEHEFSLMKTGCVFVNSARAGIVDERAFMNAMRDGTIGYAALDVQWEEPLSHGPLLEMNNIVFARTLAAAPMSAIKSWFREFSRRWAWSERERYKYEDVDWEQQFSLKPF